MKCGEAIMVKDMYGAIPLRFIAQCDGRFMQISSRIDIPNGYLYPDWHGVVRLLVGLAVPARLVERVMSAESTATGRYVHIPLTYPLLVQGLADLVGAPVDEVRVQLADLLVEVSDADRS